MMGTFTKSFGSAGGYVAASKECRDTMSVLVVKSDFDFLPAGSHRCSSSGSARKRVARIGTGVNLVGIGGV